MKENKLFENMNLEEKPFSESIKKPVDVQQELQQLVLDKIDLETYYQKINERLPNFQFTSLYQKAKDLLMKASILISIIAPSQELKTQNSTSDQQSVEISRNMEQYSHLGAFLALNLASEKPNNYQLQQIEQVQLELIKELESQKFDSNVDLLAHINKSIDCDFSSRQRSINLKDAFATRKDQEPAGGLDCDSRAVLCLSILEKIGFDLNKVQMVMSKGHAMLKIKEENEDLFFELNDNQVRDLTETERLELNTINSSEKYQAYLLGKEAVDMASLADNNPLINKRRDYEKMRVALMTAKQAFVLDQGNLTNNLNLLKIAHKAGEGSLSTDEQKLIVEKIRRNYLNNFYNINDSDADSKTIILRASEIQQAEFQARKLEDMGDIDQLSKEALANNETLREAFFDLGFQLHYDLNNSQLSSELLSLLVESYENVSSSDKLLLLSKIILSRAHFKSANYEEFLNISRSLYFKNTKELSDSDLATLQATIMAAELINNEFDIFIENKEKLEKIYSNHPLLSPFLNNTHRFSVDAIEALEALKKWERYEDFISYFNANN
jgi:hypothetical protein